MDRDCLSSKSDLEKKIQGLIPWFEYAQVEHLFRRTKYAPVSSDAMLPFEDLQLSSTTSNKGLVSRIYWILHTKIDSESFKFQDRWHKDIGFSLTPEQWHTIWSSSLFRSRSINVQILTYKVLYWWHMTPMKLHRINRPFQACAGEDAEARFPFYTAGGFARRSNNSGRRFVLNSLLWGICSHCNHICFCLATGVPHLIY